MVPAYRLPCVPRPAACRCWQHGGSVHCRRGGHWSAGVPTAREGSVRLVSRSKLLWSPALRSKLRRLLRWTAARRNQSEPGCRGDDRVLTGAVGAIISRTLGYPVDCWRVTPGGTACVGVRRRSPGPWGAFAATAAAQLRTASHVTVATAI